MDWDGQEDCVDQIGETGLASAKSSRLILISFYVYLWKANSPMEPTSRKTLSTASPWSCPASTAAKVGLKRQRRLLWPATFWPSSVEMRRRSGCCLLVALTTQETWRGHSCWPGGGAGAASLRAGRVTTVMGL